MKHRYRVIKERYNAKLGLYLTGSMLTLPIIKPALDKLSVCIMPTVSKINLQEAMIFLSEKFITLTGLQHVVDVTGIPVTWIVGLIFAGAVIINLELIKNGFDRRGENRC